MAVFPLGNGWPFGDIFLFFYFSPIDLYFTFFVSHVILRFLLVDLVFGNYDRDFEGLTGEYAWVGFVLSKLLYAFMVVCFVLCVERKNLLHLFPLSFFRLGRHPRG